MHIKTWLAGAFLLVAPGIAAAQTIVIQPEQETVIREYIVRNPVESVAPPAGFEILVGAEVPEPLILTPIDEPGATYQYVIVDGRTLLVDPGSRKVVQILQ